MKYVLLTNYINMIPKLTLDIEAIHENWKEHPETWPEIEEICEQVKIGDGSIPAYSCDEYWIRLEVFKEFKDFDRRYEDNDYGYCDTEDALIKYLKKYIDSPDNFFVKVGLLSMDYEEYYKFGSYIDENGVDTGNDYDWDSDSKQQYEGNWIRFDIIKLV